MDNHPHNNHRAARFVKYAVIILGAVLVILIAFLLLEYRTLRRAQVINLRESLFTAFVQHRGPLTASDASFIAPWMTFDYLNKTFDLPADYLKTQLQISDARYPRLSISGYARSQHLDVPSFLASVIGAVRDHLSGK